MMTMKFDKDNPFTLQIARQHEGKEVVLIIDNGVEQQAHKGMLKPLTRSSSFVGDKVVLNNRVVQILVEV